MIDVGLVGFGFAGKTFHAPVVSAVSGLRLAAIMQRTGSDAAEAYPQARVVRTLEELLAQDSIRVVAVATPNPSHFSIARECLLRGKDVVIDKPFATTCQEALELARIARANGRLLTVYQNRRWDGDFLTVQRLVSESTLGRLVLFESHFDRFRPEVDLRGWRERDEPGSGVLFDLGAHLIDHTMVLFGNPEAVSAEVRIERSGATVDDAFDVVLRYPNLRAVLRATMLAAAPGPRFQLNGTRGSYVKYGLDPQEAALKRGEIPGGPSWGKESQECWGKLTTVGAGAVAVSALETEAGDYRRFYENVRDAIIGNDALAVTPEQALNVMRALELARESSAKGRVVPWRDASC